MSKFLRVAVAIAFNSFAGDTSLAIARLENRASYLFFQSCLQATYTPPIGDRIPSPHAGSNMTV
ncbi:MAG: hypothetical protein DSM106950_00325 [Stigonema ocellatum SAG 48.90 = DSM 106950]|nr:hypothetical protein [Stigonema ocellatum SAG 48.90 = DSM 106950]